MRFIKYACVGIVLLIPLLGSLYGDATGKSFYNFRPGGKDMVLQDSMVLAMIHNYQKKYRKMPTQIPVLEFALPAHNCFVSCTPFYQASTRRSRLTRFFFPNNKKCLTIKGTEATGNRDISATWLRIVGDNAARALFFNKFESTITIKPEWESFGHVFTLHKNLKIFDYDIWVAADIPCVYTQTNLKFKECDVKGNVKSFDDVKVFKSAGLSMFPSELFVLNATEAFNNPLWKYGKMKCGVQKAAGIADIDVKLGYRVKPYFDLYFKTIFPTGHKPIGEFMFEPYVGHGGHWGVGGGARFHYSAIDEFERQAGVNMVLDYQYLFSERQWRSFDLKNNGAWSRYLLVVNKNRNKREVEPGINYFTRRAKVCPNHEFNALVSFWYTEEDYNIECGGNFWYRNRESISICNFPENIVIAQFAGRREGVELALPNAFPTANISEHASRMGKEVPLNDATPIKASDLDICSARHPSAYTFTLYLTGGVNGTWKERPFKINLGGSYEFATKNTALDKWSIWLKTAFAL